MAFNTKIIIIAFFVGIFFLGIVLLIKKKELNSDTPGISLIIIGGFMSVVLSLVVVNSPSQAEFEEIDYLIFHAPSQTFQSIELEVSEVHPYLQEKTIRYFSGEHFKIVDSNDINKIVSAIRTAKKFSPNHPSSIWRLNLTLNSEMKDISFEVDHTGSSRNGTYFYFTGYGALKCDDLGKTLEDILLSKSNKANSADAKSSSAD